MTEWPEFQDIESATVTGLMKQPLIFDGRNIMNIKKIHNAGIEYHPIGKSSIHPTL
jgi:UDPglucose 6-dehydrogenase